MRRYRLRTWLRAHTPYVVSDRIPKGRRDCGAHEWYRSEGSTWHCYHCAVGRGTADDAERWFSTRGRRTRANVGTSRFSRSWPYSLVELGEAGVRFVTPLWGERRYVWDDVVVVEAVRGTLFAPRTQFLFRLAGGNDVWVSPLRPRAFDHILRGCTPPGRYRA